MVDFYPFFSAFFFLVFLCLQSEDTKPKGRKFQTTDQVLILGASVRPCEDIKRSHFSESVIEVRSNTVEFDRKVSESLYCVGQ